MNKQVYHYKDIKDKIVKAIDMIADPVRQTLSPKGANVIFQDEFGGQNVTNDGVTIAKSITVKDPVENAIIDIIKAAALKTNTAAGDGTTTCIVLTQVLTKQGLQLVEDGMNPIDLRQYFLDFAEKLKARIKKTIVQIKSDKDLENIALISVSDDKEIAKDVVKIVKTVGLDGMVFLEPNNKNKTEVIEDTGFLIKAGLFSPELRNDKSRYIASYKDIPTLITDKRLYYPEEAETILKVALEAGWKSVAIVARDFIGQAVNFFIANHAKGVIDVVLIKDPEANDRSNESLADLATYLGGKVISDKTGSLVNKVSAKDFVLSANIFVDGEKTLIGTKNKKSADLAMRISGLKSDLEKDPDNQAIKRRLSSLTNGVVTLKVGGRTPIEMRERVYRYEDAVNAARAAMRSGYVVGGGISLLRAFDSSDYRPELVPTFKKFCEAPIRQIAENCGKHGDFMIGMISANKNKNFGYNAAKDNYEDLLKAGVVDPYMVTEMAIDNSISIASVIVSAKYLIVNDVEENGQEK